MHHTLVLITMSPSIISSGIASGGTRGRDECTAGKLGTGSPETDRIGQPK